MKKRLFIGLLLIAALLLSACANARSDTDNTPPPIIKEHYTGTSGNDVTTTTAKPTEPSQPPTTTKPTEPPAPPEPPAPLHSELYLPAYTPQQIWEYFEEVALHMEYTHGSGDSSLVQKWMEPIRYRIYGNATDEDRTVLTNLFAQLNEIPGFPGIYAAEEGEYDNYSISFLTQEALNDAFSATLNGEQANGATEFWYYTSTNEIHTARVGYSTDLPQSVRTSILIEEIINSLGISDTVWRTDSVVYQYSDDNTALSDVDWIILKLLYDSTIQCGMNADACAEIVQELYY
jgi:hypothetical protein